MKWLFAMLALANVVYFGWQTSVGGTPAAEPATPRVAETGSLRLLSEAGDLMQQAPSPEATSLRPAEGEPEAVSVGTGACWRIRGLPDEDGRRLISERFQRAGFKVLAQGAERGEKTRYWVFLPSFQSDAAARTAATRVRDKGISDYYVIVDGKNRNSISLGIFSALEGARARFDQARSAGFEPKIDEITLPVRTLWLDIRHDDETSPPVSMLPKGAAAPSVISCP